MSGLADFFGPSGFDTASVEPIGDYDVIPAGCYPVVVTAAQVKATKAKTGHYLEVTFQVLDGQFKGRKLWGRFNIQNPSTTCEEIGRRELATLSQAIGVANLQVEEQLLQGVCYAEVKVKGDNNEIRTFLNQEQRNKKLAKTVNVASVAPGPPAPAAQQPAPVQQAIQLPGPPLAPSPVADVAAATIAGLVTAPVQPQMLPLGVGQPLVPELIATPAPAADQQQLQPTNAAAPWMQQLPAQ